MYPKKIKDILNMPEPVYFNSTCTKIQCYNTTGDISVDASSQGLGAVLLQNNQPHAYICVD